MSKTNMKQLEKVDVVHYEEDQDGNQFALLKEEDYWFLKEQAERVRELEAYLEIGTYINRKLRKENRRYREALGFYAKEDNHDYWEDFREGVEFLRLPISEGDRGYKARQALEESK